MRLTSGSTSSGTWGLRVWRDPGVSGRDNMRRDLQLLQQMRPADVPVLRLYTWVPPAISIGHGQRYEWIDLEACRRDGIDVVQRPTGGRAILHAAELTYAIAAPLTHPLFGHDLRSTHCILAECLAAGLRDLGVATTLSRPERDAYGEKSRQPCFVSTGRAELLAQGRKLVGSAQRRTANAFLQHGSLLLGTEHAELAGYLRLGTDTDRDAARTALLRSTITLEELLGQRPDFDSVASALVRGFVDRLRVVPSVFEPHDIDIP